MDQTVEQIEARIDRTREQLGSTLERHRRQGRGGHRLARAHARPAVADGRRRLCRRRGAGGDAAPAAARVRRPASRPLAADRRSRGRDAAAEVVGLWDNLTAALIGVASVRVKDYIAARIPGFDEQFARVEQRRTR